LPEYELSVREPGVLALTLLRCVGKLSGRNLLTRPGGAAGWWTETPEAQCPGTHIFEYSIYPHAPTGQCMWSSILREVELFTVPPSAIKRKNDQAKLEYSFLSLEPEGLQLNALKESEDGKAIVVRISNPVNERREACLSFEKKIAQASLCKLNEEVIRPLRIVKGYELKVEVKPFEILTMKIKLKKRN
jgi:alpha-mannosidase